MCQSPPPVATVISFRVRNGPSSFVEVLENKVAKSRRFWYVGEAHSAPPSLNLALVDNQCLPQQHIPAMRSARLDVCFRIGLCGREDRAVAPPESSPGEPVVSLSRLSPKPIMRTVFVFFPGRGLVPQHQAERYAPSRKKSRRRWAGVLLVVKAVNIIHETREKRGMAWCRRCPTGTHSGYPSNQSSEPFPTGIQPKKR